MGLSGSEAGRKPGSGRKKKRGRRGSLQPLFSFIFWCRDPELNWGHGDFQSPLSNPPGSLTSSAAALANLKKEAKDQPTFNEAVQPPAIPAPAPPAPGPSMGAAGGPAQQLAGMKMEARGAGPAVGTDTSGMPSMADTAFGATPLGQAIGKGMAKGAKALMNKAIPFSTVILEKAKPDLFSYEPTLKGWSARGQDEGLSGPVGTPAGGIGPPSTVGRGAAAGFGNASTPGSISGGAHSPSGAALGSASAPMGLAAVDPMGGMAPAPGAGGPGK